MNHERRSKPKQEPERPAFRSLQQVADCRDLFLFLETFLENHPGIMGDSDTEVIISKAADILEWVLGEENGFGEMMRAMETMASALKRR